MLSKMAASKVVSVSQNYLLNFSRKCWNFQQRNISKQRIVMELVGNVNRPKKPMSAFLRFALDHKNEIATHSPEKKLPDIMKVLGSHWSKLPNNEKQKYFNMYEEEKKVYLDKMKLYEDSVANLEKDKIIQAVSNFKNADVPKANAVIKNMLKKTLNKPKAPSAPYIKFLTQNKVQGQILNIKKLAEKWKNLTDDEKSKYKQEYFKERMKYEQELESWEKRMIKEGHLDVVRLKTLKEEVNKFP